MNAARASFLAHLAFLIAGVMALVTPDQALASQGPRMPADAPPAISQLKPKQDPTPPVSNLEDVQQAVVRIEAVGVFKDPSEGMLMEAGSGSGFIIDTAGRVVTNNHVVTGAAYYKVYLQGQSTPVNARVLGVSECADLAVIDLEGDGYPYLAWYEEPIKVGLDVYAAGFPLGDPEYTLTRGIVAKARTGGESNWASVDGVIQHDAIIDHGNSGGPLVTADGQIVGINYAGNIESNQYYAIGRDGALPVIRQLLNGVDVDSIGVNGQAFVSDDGEFYGIWVASVASGSPADNVGMEPGDIILSLEGLPISEDGTMSTYCEILRSHSADDVMSIEVLRLDTEEVLEGQINGRPLQLSIDLSGQLGAADSTASAEDPAAAPAEAYTEYVEVSDATQTFTLEVPAAWTDVSDGEWTLDDETVGVRIDISPNLDDFYNNWGIPGVIARFSTTLPDQMEAEELLDTYTLEEQCTDKGRDTINLGDLAGSYQIWTDCTDAKASGAIVVLAPTETQAYYFMLELYGSNDADFDAWDRILNSLVVNDGPQQAEKPAPQTASESPLFELVDTEGLEYGYVALEDPALTALIPAEYGDIDSAVWTNKDGEPLGYTITAAPDIEKFKSTWTTPGIIVKSAVGLTSELDLDELMTDESLDKNCTYDDRYTESHEILDYTYTVVYDIYNECGDTDSSYVVLIAQSDPIDQAIFIDYLVASDADIEAFTVLVDSFYLDSALAGDIPPAATESTDVTEPEVVAGPAYMRIVDDSETISVRVPESWIDIVSEDWDLGDGPIGVALTATPDLDGFNDTWETPGVFIGVSEDVAAVFTPEGVLDAFDFSDTCTYDERIDYGTQNLSGAYDIWTDCDDVQGEAFVVLAATPAAQESPMILVYVNIIAEEDVDAFSEILASLAVAGAVESTQAAEQEELVSAPLVIVKADTLNVRSGPGTNYNRIGTVNAGDTLIVSGQANGCSWLQIVTPAGFEGWVSGSDNYVTLEARCADIPETEGVPAAPASGGQGGSAAGSQAASGGKADQGCYLFQNELGAELTITFTNSSTGKGETFKVPSDGEVEKCFAPGKYTYTLDAPPPWGSTNGEMRVEAGDAFLFPITPE
ncbi:MAG: trypsin-like peptidase domain-containing protein [Caldilineaceae bacterium]|nr:trypsin-like peptidase domain-containing protein [Caldilineaceae bacterium]